MLNARVQLFELDFNENNMLHQSRNKSMLICLEINLFFQCSSGKKRLRYIENIQGDLKVDGQ